jgi:hypothetical protein
MKSRNCLSFAAIVALVLAVAAMPCHATERRDPLIVPEAPQMPAAKITHHAHAKGPRKKPATMSTRKQYGSSASADKSSRQGVNPLVEAKDESASESSSNSGKSARTSAGK